MSHCNHLFSTDEHHANKRRSNPAITPDRTPALFRSIALALEAETIQGQTANRVVEAAKRLIQATGVDANQLLNGLTPETQRNVRVWFS